MPGDELLPRPAVDDAFFEDLLAASGERDAGDGDPIGFVAVGGGSDADLRYLTGVDGPEREYAFVRVADERVLCAPSGYADRARRQFDGRVATERAGAPPGTRAAAVLDAAVDAADDADAPPASDVAPVVLAPPTIPHDAALYLERAGYELRSTTAVRTARATKRGAEIDAIRAVQRAGVAAVRRAESILAAAEAIGDADDTHGADSADGALGWRGDPLTIERLRREIDAELARRGVGGAGNTVVTAGPTTPDGDAPSPSRAVRRAEPVRIEVAPRGPHGYHGACSRAVVVDSDGGWERRAYLAVESALDAALGAVEPGADPGDVAREADAEVTAFGFDPAQSGRGPLATVHGVGLAARERPFAAGDDPELEPGAVLAIAPSVVDPDEGCVRLGALVAVTEDGYQRLGDGSPSFAPRAEGA